MYFSHGSFLSNFLDFSSDKGNRGSYELNNNLVEVLHLKLVALLDLHGEDVVRERLAMEGQEPNFHLKGGVQQKNAY